MKPEILEFQTWAESSLAYLKRLGFSEKSVKEYAEAVKKLVETESEKHRKKIEQKRILQKMESAISSMSPLEKESVPVYLLERFEGKN